MDQLQQKLELVNKEAEKIAFLKFISDKTKIPPAYFMIATLLVLVFIVVLGIGSSFVSRLIGVLYPSIKSIQALETRNKDDDKQWLTYWCIFGLFIMLDEFAYFLLDLIPLYYFGKVCFLIWLFNPTTQGATLLYQALVKPLYKKY